MSMGATRELCSRCGGINRIGFQVPGVQWKAVAQGRWAILCLACFAVLADEMLIAWDSAIEFFPVSFVTHIGAGEPQGPARPLTVTQRARRAASGSDESVAGEGVPGVRGRIVELHVGDDAADLDGPDDDLAAEVSDDAARAEQGGDHDQHIDIRDDG